MCVFGVILACIYPHSEWIPRDTECLFVFHLNAGKCRPEYGHFLRNVGDKFRQLRNVGFICKVS